MFEKGPFKKPDASREKQGGDKSKRKTLREKVSEALGKRANMTPEEREDDRKARMQEYIHGKKIELTPEEEESQKKREERAARLRDSI